MLLGLLLGMLGVACRIWAMLLGLGMDPVGSISMLLGLLGMGVGSIGTPRNHW